MTKNPETLASFKRRRGSGFRDRLRFAGQSWGLRFWNGFGEQMATVFLPNARVSDDQKFLKEPNWNRLEFYYQLRYRLFGEPIPQDYAAAASAEWPESAA